jgi:hypothetical protein
MTGFDKTSKTAAGYDVNTDDDSLSFIQLQHSLKRRKCSLPNVIFWIIASVMFILTVLVTLQPMFESFGRPGPISGERFVQVEHQGMTLSIRVQCMGPSYDNKI